ncbi:MAG: hypothetical protein LC798_05290 [Chloroflexi bacterium]|nr:hypothetical protein [Chloroflexota bacterium]
MACELNDDLEGHHTSPVDRPPLPRTGTDLRRDLVALAERHGRDVLTLAKALPR